MSDLSCFQLDSPDSGLVVAIDASRNRSGGAKTHLLGILNSCDPREHGVRVVHIWSYSSLLDQIPEFSWLIKHRPIELDGSLFSQIWWQQRQFHLDISRTGCDVLLSTDAGTVCHFEPDVVMSRCMLPFEGGEMERYPLFTFSRFRLWLLKWLHIRSLRRGTAALFLTQYAADVIQTFTGPLKTVRIIPHGIGDDFRRETNAGDWINGERTVTCTYVSNADLYKHQWHVVQAIAMLRHAGLDVRLKLVGAGSGPALDQVLESVKRLDPDRLFVDVLPAQAHERIAQNLFETDVFIFASSCENMPNILLEAMAAGLPIACSDRGPMPEILQNAGIYFNPEDPNSIFKAVKEIIDNRVLRLEISRLALERSRMFSWTRCAKETWQFLCDVHNAHLQST